MENRSVFIVSHNNAREGAPVLCHKLYSALKKSGRYRYVGICTFHGGANPISIPVSTPGSFVASVAAAAKGGLSPVVILSTVVMARLANRVRESLRDSGVDDSGYELVCLVHEVRNETFSWVTPQHLEGFDRLVFVAEYTMNSYGEEYAPGVPRTAIHNWLSAAEKHAIDSFPVKRGAVILMVGVVAPHKGQLHVAKAFARIREHFPSHEFHLIGHVYDEAYLRKIKVAVPDVVVRGAVDEKAVAHAMRTCELFVHGSAMESCCLSIMEAMYGECPILASRVGGVPEQIDDGDGGILYDHGDVEQCAARMEALLLNADVRRDLGANARRACQTRFYEKEQVEKYNELFLQLE